MAKTPTTVDYVVAKLEGDNKYQVTKFGDGEVPLQVYLVTYNPTTGYGRCDCPAAAYRNTGSMDKHVLMVKGWLMKPQTGSLRGAVL